MGDGIKRNVLNYWEQPQDTLRRDNKLVIGGSAEQTAESNFILYGNVAFNGPITFSGVVTQAVDSTFDLNGTVNLTNIINISGTTTVSGDLTQTVDSTFDLNGDVRFDGTLTLGETSAFISEGLDGVGALNMTSPKFVRALISSMDSGLTDVDGNFLQLVGSHPTDVTLVSVLGGKAQIIDDTILGKPVYKEIVWGPVPDYNPGVSYGLHVIAVDANGTVVTISNGTGRLTPRQALDYIQIGSITIVDVGLDIPFVATAFNLSLLACNKGLDLYTVGILLTAFNAAGAAGFRIVPEPGTLFVNQLAGSGFDVGGGTDVDHRTTDYVAAGDAAISLVAIAHPITGSFYFSPTGEIDTSLRAVSGKITSAVSAGGGTQTVFSTELAHGMLVATEVTVDTPDYYFIAPIVAKTATTFTVNIPYAGPTVGGRPSWSALIPVSNGKYTAIRCFLFSTSGPILGTYAGQKEYSSVSDYRAQGGEGAETFREPGVSLAAMPVDVIVVQKGATNLDNISVCEFVPTQKRIR